MKKIILNVLKFTVFLSLGILLLWFALRKLDFNKFWTYIENANYWWILLSLVFAWFGFLFRAWRWKLLIDPLGYNVKLSTVYHAVSIGYMANFAFPRIGEVSRCAVVNRSEKVPFESLIGTVITERISDVIMLLLIMILVFFAKINFFGKYLSENIISPILDRLTHAFSSLWIAALFSVLLLSAFIFLVFIFKARIKKIAMVQKIRSLAKGVLNGVLTAYHMKKKFQFLFFTLLIWLVCYWMMTWIPVFSMPATSHLDAMDGLFLLVVGGLAVTAPVQGGIGIFHAMIAFALNTLYGIDIEQAYAFAFIIHGSSSLLYILLGGISFLILFLKRKKEEKATLNK